MTDRSNEPLLVDDTISTNHRGANDSLILFVRDSMKVGDRLTSSEIVKQAIGLGRCRRSLDAYKVQNVMKRCPYVKMIPRGALIAGQKRTTKVALWERVEYFDE